MQSCAFTGHRSISPSHLSYLPMLLRRGIEYLYRAGVRDFYAGGALGFDTLAAEAVLLYRAEHPDTRLHLLLPHKGQEETWRREDILRYRRILDASDSYTYLADAYYDGVMRERNADLVEHADAVIAYYLTRGGTAQTVAMAKKKGIPVYNLALRLQRMSND